MKRQYNSPAVTEFGRIETMTLGSGGNKPDGTIVGGVFTPNGTNCSDPSPITTSCLVIAS